MAPAPQFRALPPQQAIAYFRARGLNLRETGGWQEMWQGEHATAFTVAQSAGFDVLKDIHAAMLAAIEKGTTFQAFAAQLKPTLQAKGWWGKITREDGRVVQLGSMRRLQTIFDVNMRTAYMAGRWAAVQRTKIGLPFLQYDAVNDERTRPLHRSWDDIILPVDDPWWDTHFPPNGWRCRCDVRQITGLQAQRAGGPSRRPDDGTRAWFNARTGTVDQVPVGIDPGWDYNPGKAAFSQHAARALYEKAADAPPAVAAHAIAASTEFTKRNLVADFAAWARGILDRTTQDKTGGDRRIVGVLGQSLIGWLEGRGIHPASGALTIGADQVRHLNRASKGPASVAEDVVRALPRLVDQPRAILWDRDEGNLVYVLDGNGSTVKVIVGVNRRQRVNARDVRGRGTVTTNSVFSGSTMDPNALLDRRRYELIEGRI